MFFGLTNLPATFQTMIDEIFKKEMALGQVIIYMDDILITIDSKLNYHHLVVECILKKLQDNNLFLKLEKY